MKATISTNPLTNYDFGYSTIIIFWMLKTLDIDTIKSILDFDNAEIKPFYPDPK